MLSRSEPIPTEGRGPGSCRRWSPVGGLPCRGFRLSQSPRGPQQLEGRGAPAPPRPLPPLPCPHSVQSCSGRDADPLQPRSSPSVHSLHPRAPQRGGGAGTCQAGATAQSSGSGPPRGKEAVSLGHSPRAAAAKERLIRIHLLLAHTGSASPLLLPRGPWLGTGSGGHAHSQDGAWCSPRLTAVSSGPSLLGWWQGWASLRGSWSAQPGALLSPSLSAKGEAAASQGRRRAGFSKAWQDAALGGS